MYKKFEDWLTDVCLDIFDWYTKMLVEMAEEMKNAKKLG